MTRSDDLNPHPPKIETRPRRKAKGYRDGVAKDIELVLVQGDESKGIWLEAATARAFLSMEQAARADGIELDIESGHRDHELQKRLRAERHNPDGTLTKAGRDKGQAAKPGWSKHESGEAIDFKNCNDDDDPVYKWLVANASRFGFKRTVLKGPPRGDGERWHWEHLGVTVAPAPPT